MPQLGVGRGATQGFRVSVGNSTPLPALSSLFGTEEKSISVLSKPLIFLSSLLPLFLLIYYTNLDCVLPNTERYTTDKERKYSDNLYAEK